MKVIDLLNKKANGEELPSVINCYNQTFYLSDGIYIAKNQVGKYFEDYFDFSSLDYKVETIEDTLKVGDIEKLDIFSFNKEILTNEELDIENYLSDVCSKINEIINKINKTNGE